MPVITISAVNTGTDTMTATAHGLVTGERFRVHNVGGALPTGLAAVTDYFAIRTDNDNLKAASSSANAFLGTAIDITGAGSGTNTVEYGLPYCIPTALAAPGTQIKSANDNGAWNSLVALYDLLTAQAQSIWASVTLAVALVMNAAFTVAQAWFQTGVISPTTITGANHNYAPTGFATATILRITGTANGDSITGIAGGAAGRRIVIFNVGGTTFDLVSESASSTAANRMLFSTTPLTIGLAGGIELWYDTTSSRWRSVRP